MSKQDGRQTLLKIKQKWKTKASPFFFFLLEYFLSQN